MTGGQITDKRSEEGSKSTDTRLVRLAKAGDVEALEALIRNFKPTVYSKAKKYYLAGGDREDVIQEGLIGLYKAIRDFRLESHIPFRTFAGVCIDRQLFTAIKGASRMKHAPLNSYVSFEARNPSDEGPYLGERISDGIEGDPVDYLASRENCRSICRRAAERLSELEARVLAMCVEGLSYDQIASLVGCDFKAVDNALQRARRKMAEAIAASALT